MAAAEDRARAIERAIAIARRRRRRVLLRVKEPCAEPPRAVWKADRFLSETADWALVGGAAEPWLAARGRALVATPGGEEPLPALARECSQIREQLVGGGEPDPLPWALVGVAFDPSRPLAAPWTGWPRALLWVPEELLVAQPWGALWRIRHLWVRPDASVPGIQQRLRAPARPAPQPATAPSAAPAPLDRAGWRGAARRALDRIGEGGLTKIVLARAARLDRPGDPVRLARNLAARDPRAFTFLVRGPGGSSFVGSTPELLVRTRGDRCATEALAGTVAGSGPTPTRALLASSKDRHEHAIVVEALAQRLAPLTLSLDIPAVPEVRSLGSLSHLATPIIGTRRPGVGVLDLVAALHPTPAVGGQPAEAAEALRRELEATDRGWYAGPLGWVAPNGDGTFAVALRSALVRGGAGHAFAGAGIVRGSAPDAEWRETETKLATIRGACECAGGAA